MREMYVNTAEFPGCCAINVLSEFITWMKEDPKDAWNDILDTKPLVDAEWYGALYRSTCGDNIPLTSVAMWLFTHSWEQNEGVCTPAKLARWLRSKGERVSASKKIINPKTNNKVTLYCWSPSKKFIASYEKNKKKIKDAANASYRSRGPIAA